MQRMHTQQTYIGPIPIIQIGHYIIPRNPVIHLGNNRRLLMGTSINTGETVCIKKIKLANQSQRSLAIHEAQSHMKMNHPNVLRFSHCFHDRNSTYIVTETYQALLLDKIRKFKKLRQGQALEIFLQILSGYEEVRKKGYLHRNLKPQNIFFKEESVKLGEFSLCIQLKRPQIKAQYKVGSPLYMAPQAIESNIYSEKSDVWSLGIILYEMLHGKTPFNSQQEQDLITEMKNFTIQYDCHLEIERILRGALNYDRRQRFTLKELQDSLIQFMSQEPQIKKRLNSLSRHERAAYELRYIRLMEYIKDMTKSNRKNQKSARIIFVFEYGIRSRLKLLEDEEFFQVFKEPILGQMLNTYKERYNSKLSFLTSLAQDDRLRFLNPDVPSFDYFALWQIQAQLKDTLTFMLRAFSIVKEEEKVAMYEKQLKWIDFLLSAYVINRFLIESENSMQEWPGRQQLTTVLTSPQRLNLEVWQAIQQKAQALRII